jgi:6-phosphogluconolactonase
MKRVMARVLVCLGVTVAAATAASVPLAAAQRTIYIGTYTGETSKGIYAFKFDDASGELTPMGLVAETPSPSFLIASADGRFVYAVNELQNFAGAASGSVTAFSVDRASGKLTELNVQPTEGGGPCHLALDRTGRYLAVANYGGGNFAILPVGSDGRLQKAVTVVTGQNADTGTAKPLGHMVGFDASNKFLITADKGLNRMLVFRFDAATGKVTPNTPPSAVLPPGSGPRHYAMHQNGEWLFTIAEQGATITTFKWDGKAGSLTATGSVPTRPAEVTTGSTAEIALHPNGKFVYGSNRGHDSIAVFSIGAAGALTLVEYEPTRGQTPRNFAIDPSGRWLIAANQRSGTLAVFSIDQNTGALSPVGGLTSVGAPVCVLFM